MIISDDNLWKILLVLGGFVIGKIWQHEGKIGKRVTYEHCTKNRENCPCIREINEINRKLDNHK